LALMSSAIISQTGIFVRFLTDTYGLAALDLVFWRNALVCASLLCTTTFTGRPRLIVAPKNLLFLAAYGLILAVFNGVWTTAVICSGAAVSTVLAYCSVGYTALLGAWLFDERLNQLQQLAVCLSLAGCLLVSNALVPEAWNGNATGIVTGILSGLLYAGYSLMGREAARRGVNAWTTIFHIFTFAALFQMAAIVLFGEKIPILTAGPGKLLCLNSHPDSWLWLLLYAVGPTLVGFGLYAKSLNYLPAAMANIIVTLELVFTGITAYLLFGETFQLLQWAGCMLIVAAILLLNLSIRKQQKTPPPNAKENCNAYKHP